LKTYVISEEKNKIEPFFYSKPNSFQVKKKKRKEKAEHYCFKTYDISEKKKKTEPFFGKKQLRVFLK
jgi:hypothetical protein